MVAAGVFGGCGGRPWCTLKTCRSPPQTRYPQASPNSAKRCAPAGSSPGVVLRPLPPNPSSLHVYEWSLHSHTPAPSISVLPEPTEVSRHSLPKSHWSHRSRFPFIPFALRQACMPAVRHARHFVDGLASAQQGGGGAGAGPCSVAGARGGGGAVARTAAAASWRAAAAAVGFLARLPGRPGGGGGPRTPPPATRPPCSAIARKVFLSSRSRLYLKGV